jgi:hypothetical protein
MFENNALKSIFESDEDKVNPTYTLDVILLKWLTGGELKGGTCNTQRRDATRLTSQINVSFS